jgi:hypothetical protein
MFYHCFHIRLKGQDFFHQFGPRPVMSDLEAWLECLLFATRVSESLQLPIQSIKHTSKELYASYPKE